MSLVPTHVVNNCRTVGRHNQSATGESFSLAAFPIPLIRCRPDKRRWGRSRVINDPSWARKVDRLREPEQKGPLVNLQLSMFTKNSAKDWGGGKRGAVSFLNMKWRGADIGDIYGGNCGTVNQETQRDKRKEGKYSESYVRVGERKGVRGCENLYYTDRRCEDSKAGR